MSFLVLVCLGIPDLVSVKELVHLLSGIQHAEGRYPGETSEQLRKLVFKSAPKHVNDARELIVLAGAGEQRQTKEELDGDATQGPDINSGSVRHSQ